MVLPHFEEISWQVLLHEEWMYMDMNEDTLDTSP